MADSLETLKELALQVRTASKEGDNTAEKIGRIFTGILVILEDSGINFDIASDDDPLDTLKGLAEQIRNAAKENENTAERIGRVFKGTLKLLEHSGILFDSTEGGDSINILIDLSLQVRKATKVGENTAEKVGRILVGVLNLLVNFTGEAFDFLVRSDLPDYYYSSTQDTLNAIRATYPDGLTQHVTISCVKPAKEKNPSKSWLASLADWNNNSFYYLTIDGADKLTYDGNCLGGLQFKNVDNILLRNLSFVNCANYATYNSPDELSAVSFAGNANRRARNLMLYKCSFDGAYPAATNRTSRRTISSKYSENVTLLGCRIVGDSGNCILLTDCMYMSLIKNNIIVSTTTGDVGHPSIITIKNSYSLTIEDNDLSGNNQENFIDLTNVDRLYLRRNRVYDSGGRVMSLSVLKEMKEVVIESNLFAGMLNAPSGGWMKEYVNLGTSKVKGLKVRNNTFYMSGSFYEQNALRGGTVENADIYNNIVINAAGVTANGFVFNKVKNLSSGNNIYQAIRGMIYSPNAEGTEGYIAIDWATAVDISKLQAAGYEAESVKAADGIAVIEKQSGGGSYRVTYAINEQYKSNDAQVPFADVDYKRNIVANNSLGCYNLSGTVIDESGDSSTGYSGEDYTVSSIFGSAAQYSTMADDILLLRHNTLDRMKLIVFSASGSQHRYMILGKSGVISPMPELDDNNEYEADELYTVKID